MKEHVRSLGYLKPDTGPVSLNAAYVLMAAL